MDMDCLSKYVLICTFEKFTESRITTWLYNLSDEWKTSLDIVRNTVSESHWNIYLNYLFSGQNCRQVAKQFGTTETNVRVITHRVRKKLKEQHGKHSLIAN